MTPLNVPALLRRFGLKPRKSLGQNFLVDEGALAKVTAAAELTPADTVLEIGPGLGSLTRYLAQVAARVVAVELDRNLLAPLKHVLADYPNVEIVHGDILNFQPSTFNLPTGYKVVANIPYYITSAVIRHLLEAGTQPSRIVLTVQKEVAQRLCAPPGALSLLAVSAQFYSEPRVVARIPAGAFYPQPEVDSAVVRLDVRAQPAVKVPDAETFFRVVKAGFGQKRKQLRNALGAGLGLNSEAAEALLVRAGIDPKRRAETLTLAEWGKLAHAWQAFNQNRGR
ncbi:MAG: 16S rRNA (adenine(1518)-N(6)/adenine(1519)-N(6))-dimethyltransferase RsmA [Anaerolineales bacterium]|nr:16S rRNA (adenine(1518)-N(6)/adenine(1519)-N(6))-dimethyltransferase RsmA [Anaerolineales bacterium]